MNYHNPGVETISGMYIGYLKRLQHMWDILCQHRGTLLHRLASCAWHPSPWPPVSTTEVYVAPETHQAAVQRCNTRCRSVGKPFSLLGGLKSVPSPVGLGHPFPKVVAFYSDYLSLPCQTGGVLLCHHTKTQNLCPLLRILPRALDLALHQSLLSTSPVLQTGRFFDSTLCLLVAYLPIAPGITQW